MTSLKYVLEPLEPLKGDETDRWRAESAGGRSVSGGWGVELGGVHTGFEDGRGDAQLACSLVGHGGGRVEGQTATAGGITRKSAEPSGPSSGSMIAGDLCRQSAQVSARLAARRDAFSDDEAEAIVETTWPGQVLGMNV